MYEKKNTLIGVAVVILISAGLYMNNPVSIGQISTVEGFVAYARSFGPIMPAAIFFVTAVQAIVPVIPFVILCIANGILFGMLNGILITWAGTLTGASIAFYVSRKLGYEWASRSYRDTGLKNFDNIEGLRGFFVILGLRLLPYFPAPLINVSAGVSTIRFFWFLLASAIGKLPFIVGYSVLGYSLLSSKNYLLGIGLMAILIVLPFSIVFFRKKRAQL